jgi:hypothetical protein
MSEASRANRPKRICRKKVRYPTALQAAGGVTKAWFHNNLFLKTYKCDQCDGYHLTSGGWRAKAAA